MSALRTSVPLVLWLTAVWVGLWGSVTPANVLGGLAVAGVLVLGLPLTVLPDRAVVSPWWLLRFLAFFAVDLVRASLQVAGQVLRPRLVLRQAVVALPARAASDHLLTLLANAISLTPGTLTLEVDRPGRTLYVHVLQLGSGQDAVEQARRELVRLERLAVAAIGAPASRATLDPTSGGAP